MLNKVPPTGTLKEPSTNVDAQHLPICTKLEQPDAPTYSVELVEREDEYR